MKFTPDNYFPFVYGSGAEKLADSQIAPLVAAARGYQSFSDQDSEESPSKRLAEATKRASGGTGFTAAAVRNYFRDGADVLFMPWYSAGTVMKTPAAQVADYALAQLRPEHPIVDKTSGRPLKYVFPKSAATPVSTHPAMTEEWAETSPKIFITEGILKEDALLTHILLHAGITPEELMIPAGVTHEMMGMWSKAIGIKMVRDLLERVPAEQRIMPLSVAGVSGWKVHQFANIRMQGKQVTIAFDGDVKSNPMVWNEANKLWELIGDRGGRPALLAIGSAAALYEIRQSDKFKDFKESDGEKSVLIGVDDYLSHVGTLGQLLAHVDHQLPTKPAEASAGYKNGDWRVTADGCGTEEFRSGGDFGGGWVPRVPLGGHVESVSVTRAPTLEEVRQSAIHASEDRSVKQYANLTVTWRDEFTGNKEEVRLEVDIAQLNKSPERWSDSVQSTIPSKLNMHPDWPPTGTDGMNWIRAIKRNSGEGLEARRSWEATGWVPSDGGLPVYIVGEQVLGATREDERRTGSAVDDGILPNASDFGVDDIWWDIVDPNGTGEITADGLDAYKRRLRADIETVVKHFIDGGVWAEKHFGPVTLGAALRSTIPKRPGVPLLMNGTPGTGKSWTASFMMGAWQARKGVWSAQHLPGSASSTAFALEKIISVCGGGMWIADDLAPSVSQSAAINAEAGMEGIVRAMFNQSSRQRGTKDGGLAKASQPRAMLVVTAENSLTSTSALERVLELRFYQGVMENNAAEKLISEVIDSLALSRVTAAMIRFWHHSHQAHHSISEEPRQMVTWGEKLDNLEAVHSGIRRTLGSVLAEHFSVPEGQSARRVQLISEILLSLVYLEKLYLWAEGNDPATISSLRTFKPEFFQTVKERCEKFGVTNATIVFVSLAAEQLKTLTERKIGASTLQAIAAVLQGGFAHLDNPATPGLPPFPTNTEWQSTNIALGWEVVRGEWVAKGSRIGSAGLVNGEPIAALHSKNAFSIAQSRQPQLVPHGQKDDASWRAAIAEGLAQECPGKGYSRQVAFSRHRVRGVIVPIEHIVGQ